MNNVVVKIQISIAVIIFWINGCKKIEHEKIPAVTTDDIEIY